MTQGTQKHVRPRRGPSPMYVEYDGPNGTRERKLFPSGTAAGCRKFFVEKSMTGKNPCLVRAE